MNADQDDFEGIGHQVVEDGAEGIEESLTVEKYLLDQLKSAVDSCVSNSDSEENDSHVASAYIVEVIDSEGFIVPIPKEQSRLTFTFDPTDTLSSFDKAFSFERTYPWNGLTETEWLLMTRSASNALSIPMTDGLNVDGQGVADLIDFNGEACHIEDWSLGATEDHANVTVKIDGVQSLILVNEKSASQESKHLEELPEVLSNALKALSITEEDKGSSEEPESLKEVLDEESGPDSKNSVGNGYVMRAMANEAPINNVGVDENRISLRGTGFKLNLFNYVENDSNNNKLGANGSTINVTKEGINSEDGNTLRPFLFFGGGTETNQHLYNGWTGDHSTPLHRIVYNNLQKGTDGNYYPVLANNATGGISGGTSLQYLFDGDNTVRGKTAYMDVDGLFERDDDGYYGYDSNENYAYYDTSTNNEDRLFKIYNSTYNRSGNTDNSGSGITDYKIGFFPFNDWNSSSTDLVSPGNKDHFFGMSLHGTFVMPEGIDYQGHPTNLVTYDNVQHPMLFEMGGDDDIWVFIDGVLVLDLGGIHQPAHGIVNLTNGTITYIGDPIKGRYFESNVLNKSAHIYEADDAYGTAVPTSEIRNTDISENGKVYRNHTVRQTTMDTAFTYAGKSADELWSKISAPGTAHTIDIFYLERGSYDSNLLMRMNFPTVTTTSLSIEKDWKQRDGETSETSHQAPIYFQLYQQKWKGTNGNVDLGYDDPRPYGSPVELNSSNQFKYTYENLPVHSDLQDKYFKYIVKEGYLFGGEFIPFYSDGWTESDGTLYRNIKVVYKYGDALNPTKEETYPDEQNASFVNGNTTNVSVGTAVVTNRRYGKIVVRKEWLNHAGNVDSSLTKFDTDKVYVQLVKQTKENGAPDFSNASSVPVQTIELNKGNQWTAGFDGNTSDFVYNDPNVRYIVQEGIKDGDDNFVVTNTIPAAGNEYMLSSTEYYRTKRVYEGASQVVVTAQQPNGNDQDAVASNSQNLYWWEDVYQYPEGHINHDHYENGNTHTHWVNQVYGPTQTEILGPVDTAHGEPDQDIRTDNRVIHRVFIPYNVAALPDNANEDYDFNIYIKLDPKGSNLQLNNVSLEPFDGTYSTSIQNNICMIGISAAWAKQHAGTVIPITMTVSSNQTLPLTNPSSNPAVVTVIPTEYAVSVVPVQGQGNANQGNYMSIQDEQWPTGNGIQLLEDGTGFAVIKNRPKINLAIEKKDAGTNDVLAGATFKVYRDAGQEGEAITFDSDSTITWGWGDVTMIQFNISID